jgi:hypothetical protein
MTQDRPTANLVKTGNYFDDAPANVCEFIKREQKEDPEQELTLVRRLIDAVPNDLLIVPGTPMVTCSYRSHTEDPTTIGKTNVTHKLQIDLELYYYHQELNEQLDKREITKAVWELCRIIRRNSDLNGLSPMGANIVSSEVANRARVNGTFAGARILVRVPVLLQSRRATS